VSKKSNFNIGSVVILILLLQLVKQCHNRDWLNQSKPNKTLVEQKHKMNTEHMKRLIEKLKKEGKIKEKNFERKKPINPHK
jgi:hypothetical protein